MANQTRQLARLLCAEQFGIEVVQVNAPYRPAWIGRVRGLRAVFRLLPYLLRLSRATRRADVVHIMANSGWSWHLFAAPAVWIGRWHRTPVIVNYRGGEAATFFAAAFRWVKPTLDRTSAIVVPSDYLGQVFAQFGVDTRVVPNIIDRSRFAKRQNRPANGAPHLIVTRNLEPIYDIPTALAAFSIVRLEFPRARLTIAGSGPQRAALEAAAEAAGIAAQITFTGRLENEQMAALYAEADIMLNPSTVDNMPNSVLEALASGVPVVSTDVGGVPFLISHNETGLLVPPGDPQAMASAALRVLNEPQLAHTLTTNGSASVAAYEWPAVRQRLIALYRALIDDDDKASLAHG